MAQARQAAAQQQDNTNEATRERAAPITQADLESPVKRAKLPVKPSAYWLKLERNRYVGFRRTSAASAGNWIARVQVGRKEETEPLGKLEDIDEKLRFKVAAQKAREWFAELEAKGQGATLIQSKITLRFVLREYVADRRAHKGDTVADYAKVRLDSLVTNYTNKDGKEWIDRPVASITKAEYHDWLTWMKQAPTERNQNGEKKRRAGSSVNREMANFRAALNLAHRMHNIPNVWKETFKRDTKADVARKVTVLTIEERQRLLQGLIDTGSPTLAAMSSLMLIMPLRPGACAELEVRDWDRKAHTLHIRKDKAGAGRVIQLAQTDECRALMAAASKNKLPNAALFMDPDGDKWQADSWRHALAKAVKSARLSRKITLYYLRHSRITDMIYTDLPSMALAEVAGTSVAIIEKHYHHMRGDVLQRALAHRGY